MTDLTFNIHALARPQTAADCSAVLIEALRVLDELGELIDRNEQFLNEHAMPVAQ